MIFYESCENQVGPCYSYFIEKETEAQDCWAIYLRSHSKKVAEPGNIL